VSRNLPIPRDLGKLHYFISGPHWKHVDDDGATIALYDPETQLIHYYKPEPKVVDASVAEGPVSFEALPGAKVVLGRTCKGFRSTSSQRVVTGYYDPDLFVDSSVYSSHHFGSWAETLAFTSGGLVLWSKMELAGGDIISEPLSIQSRELDAAFWAVPKDEAAGRDGGPE